LIKYTKHLNTYFKLTLIPGKLNTCQHLENYKLLAVSLGLTAVCPFRMKYNIWVHKTLRYMVIFSHTEPDLPWWWDVKICEYRSP